MINLHQFSIVLQGQYLQWLIAGLLTTLGIFAVSWILAFFLATLLLGLRLLPARIFDLAVSAFVSYHRNVPLLVQILIWYFGVPQLLPDAAQMWINDRHGEIIFATIALAMNAAAYMTEDMRSGLRSLPAGQAEAARALGLSYRQSLIHVLLPQALRAAVPPLISQTIMLLKTTSLAMAIGVAELTYSARQIENETYLTFATFAVATAAYLVMSWTIMLAGSRYGRHRERAGTGGSAT
ncbi:ABC transporter permease subunit [Bordetella petrii]|nr:ABC transporter permease subunit [Bordetella petrii]